MSTLSERLNMEESQVKDLAKRLDGRVNDHNSQIVIKWPGGAETWGMAWKVPENEDPWFVVWSTKPSTVRNQICESLRLVCQQPKIDGIDVQYLDGGNGNTGNICKFYCRFDHRDLEQLVKKKDNILGFLQDAQDVLEGRVAPGNQPCARQNIFPTKTNSTAQENEMKNDLNRIVFGAPGTGKSYRLNEESKKSFTSANSERVTFYATYSYAQFVGTYKPVMKDVGGEEKISYEFVPGPFLRMLVNALKNPNEKFLLIIEEINRANAAAVFGDMFQLLDRDAEGKSEYAVTTSEDVRRYLVKEGLDADAVKKIQIPANLYLWATMNSADQGVFPLDTAFKRRWSFEYIGIDDDESQAPDLKIQIKNQTYDWKPLRKFLNRLLVLNGVNEDKLMGPFFLKDAAEFDSKVLMYLWEDAARMCRRAVFGEIKTYSDLCDEWKKKGIKIFDGVKSDDVKVKDCLASLQPGDNQTANDGAATAQGTSNG